jgi:hypothetical protein
MPANNIAIITAEVARLDIASPSLHKVIEFNRIKHLRMNVLFLLKAAECPYRALGIIITNQRAKSNDEASRLPHNILQKILISSSIIKAKALLKLPLYWTIERREKMSMKPLYV